MTNWMPGLVVLGVSLALGLGLAWRSWGKTRESVSARRVDLLARKEALYEQIRAGSRELEVEAAQVLYDLDHLGEEAAPPAPRAARHPQLIGAAWGAGIVLFVGSLWYGLQQYTQERPEEGAEMPVPVSAELERLKLAAESGDLAAQNAYAHALIATGKVMDAFHISEKVTESAPDDAEARTHQAVVLLEMGDAVTAAKVLDRVLANHPTFTEALGYRGAVYYDAGDFENAAIAWGKARDSDPANGEQFARLISMARPEFAGEVRLAEGVAVPEGAMLFIYARAPGVEAGPPVRVKRLPAKFPVKFTIGASDSPMGGNLSGEMVLTARVDADGNPSTKEEGAPSGKSGVLAEGATGVEILVR